MRKGAILLLVLLLGAVFASGCLSGTEQNTTTSTASSPKPSTSWTPTPEYTSSSPREYYPITIVDFANRSVTIEKEPQRVVTLAPSITEDLHFLGLFNKVVGVTNYDDFPPDVSKVERIGGYGQYANLEKIAALQPDLILADSYAMPILNDLEKIAPVVIISPTSLDDIPKALELLGKIFNREDTAKGTIEMFNQKIQSIHNSVKDEQPVKVFYVVWNDPLMTAGGGTFISDLIELAGGINIFNDTSGWPAVSPEQVIERDPDVIILTPHCGMTIQDVYNGPLANTRAAKEGKVYLIENENELIRPSPRLMMGLETLARLLHPDAFKLASEYPLKITDFAGREVTIENEPERIVTLAPSITESLFYIGAGDKVVGVTDYDDFPPAVANITRIGGYGQYANLEKIAALQPDLILADSYAMPILNDLEKIAPVIIIDPKSIDQIYNALELLGKITNRETAADAVISNMKNRVEYVTSTVHDLKKVKTFFLLSYYNGYWTAGNGTFINDLIELAGGENVFSDFNGWGAANEEQIITRNPEVIIISPNSGISPEDLCSGPLAETDAVKNGRVYVLSDENIIVRPGPRIVYGLEEIAEYIHPEAFNVQLQPLVCNMTVSAEG